MSENKQKYKIFTSFSLSFNIYHAHKLNRIQDDGGVDAGGDDESDSGDAVWVERCFG